MSTNGWLFIRWRRVTGRYLAYLLLRWKDEWREQREISVGPLYVDVAPILHACIAASQAWRAGQPKLSVDDLIRLRDCDKSARPMQRNKRA